MKQATNAPDAPVYTLGIDVSKNTLDVALLGSTGKPVTKSVTNNEDGFGALLRWVERQVDSTSAPQACQEVHACLEASGGYEAAAATWLHEQGLHVSVANPRRITGYANSQLRRSKTDRADARLLARFCQREADKLNA